MNRNPVFLITCFLSVSLITSTQQAAADTKEGKHDINVQALAYSPTGVVIETMNAGSYTYVLIDEGKEKIWMAGPVTSVKVGDVLPIDKHMPMNNFHSKTLDRDFEVVYFVGKLGSPSAMHKQDAHRDLTRAQAPNVKIKKAQNGKNIDEIYAQMKELSGKTIRVRGMVVKYTPDVMGKDWIHLRDNSSASDLTITTKDKVNKGDIVLVEGKLTLNKDFGYGYTYKMIMEDAKVTVK